MGLAVYILHPPINEWKAVNLPVNNSSSQPKTSNFIFSLCWRAFLSVLYPYLARARREENCGPPNLS